MLQTIVAPNAGHPVVYHFAEGASAFGHVITPSIAHFVQLEREIAIDYSRIGAGITFQKIPGVVVLPHVVDDKRLRLHAETSAFRQAVGNPPTGTDAILHCRVGDDCVLKLWGHVAAEDAGLRWDRPIQSDHGGTVPLLFTMSFWEIARDGDAQLRELQREMRDKDRKIRALEAKVALSMCSQ